MNIPARVGTFAIAGLLACGSIPAAHATVEATTPPIELTTKIALADADTPASSLTMPCHLYFENSAARISFPADLPFNEVTVAVDGQQVRLQQTLETSVVIDQPRPGATVHVELWDEDSLTGECEEPTPPQPDEPTATASEEPTEPTQTPSPSPSPSGPSDSETPDPSPPSTAPTATPTKPPQTPSSSATPSPTAPSSTASRMPSRTQSPVLPNDSEFTSQRPQSPMSQQPEALGPRVIRQYSDNPRYLLPRLLGLSSRSGSGLIMPHPRNSEQGPPDLETLPPVSEDELEAIKAGLSAPDRVDRATDQEPEAVDIDELLADRKSGWLLPALIGAVGLGLAVFWLLKRRKLEH